MFSLYLTSYILKSNSSILLIKNQFQLIKFSLCKILVSVFASNAIKRFLNLENTPIIMILITIWSYYYEHESYL